MTTRWRLPDDASTIDLLGVRYVHTGTHDGGDLYVTSYGVPFLEQLKPESWYAKDWFEHNREKLLGTSTVYRVRTREIAGVSKDLVVKWCRVGETVPMDTFTLSKFVEADFNSPYEEFSLVMEMRTRPGPQIILTHKPLAIYVPAKRLKLWQTGRSMTKIEQKKAKHRDVELDIYRQYILIYEWVKGVSCTEALMEILPDIESRRKAMMELVNRGVRELKEVGFRVIDMKPEHFIVRPQPGGSVLRRGDGSIAYALVDFELLSRTPEHEREVTAVRRATYLKHQKDRFGPAPNIVYPPHLRPTRILGIDYVYGQSESTQGWLWVVGKDPALFDYFLPERWRRTQRAKVSETSETYYTKTKDNINLVWKVSRLGEQPDVDAGADKGRDIVAHGYNSPFEEIEIALELTMKGVPAIYPRAVYMTGQEAAPADYHFDNSRYETHGNLHTPDGDPVLRPDHNYIVVWGYWNGSDELLATRDDLYCKGINLHQALGQNLVSREEFTRLMEQAARDLHRAGFVDLNLKATHVMLSITPEGTLIRNDDSRPALRICNFSLMKRLPTTA